MSPRPPNARSSATVASPRVQSRATIPTSAPSPARAIAVALPMPEVAPVTRQTRRPMPLTLSRPVSPQRVEIDRDRQCPVPPTREITSVARLILGEDKFPGEVTLVRGGDDPGPPYELPSPDPNRDLGRLFKVA